MAIEPIDAGLTDVSVPGAEVVLTRGPAGRLTTNLRCPFRGDMCGSTCPAFGYESWAGGAAVVMHCFPRAVRRSVAKEEKGRSFERETGNRPGTVAPPPPPPAAPSGR
jgi:hypothetical protein